MINKVILVGRLTKDPELRTATTGRSITTFTVAVDSKMKNPDGTRSAAFLDCVAFQSTAENVCKFTKKGSLVGVEGSINQRKYQRKDGSNAIVVEILCDNVKFLESKPKNEEIPPFDEYPQNGPAIEESNETVDTPELADDDLPFNV